jgi:hypothetical protein
LDTNTATTITTGSGGDRTHRHQHNDDYRRFSWALQEVTLLGSHYDVMQPQDKDEHNSSTGLSETLSLLTLGCTMCGKLLAAVLAVALSVSLTISVHYFDTASPRAGRFMTEQDSYWLYSGLSAYQKVTRLDPSIAVNNVIRRNKEDSGGLDLGKVITSTSSGQLSVLLVVHEESPLHATAKESAETTHNQPSKTTPQRPYSSDEDNDEENDWEEQGIPLSMEQYEQLLPGYREWKESQPKLDVREPMILPSLCSDGSTHGFDDWDTLRRAVQEANSISAERFMKWSEYFATHPYTALEDDSLYYEQDVIFTICPNALLKGKRPLHINAENVVLECDHCTVNVVGTHLAFGANAKNILVRGLTFRSATASSVTFFHDGAEVTFEDCTWINNLGTNQKFGSVADINSTSTVNFFSCEIGFEKQLYPFGSVSSTKSTSSLSIRSN